MIEIPKDRLDKYNIRKNELQERIKELVPNAEINNAKLLSPYNLDIYLPEQNFAIDMNNNYLNSEAILTPLSARHKHSDKTELCLKKGIRLFHIFENTWDEKKEQIVSFLKSALQKNTERVYGRECTIMEDLGIELVDRVHLQGSSKNTIKSFDLIYANECIGTILVAKHHRQNGKGNAIVLSRMAFKTNVNILGGAGKLFNYFKEWAKLYEYESIISWSDNSWTQGDIYKSLEFKLSEEYYPDYFYWDMNNDTYLSKQSQKKSNNGCPKEITEHEWCKKNGLYRIYDCGKKLWTFNLKEG